MNEVEYVRNGMLLLSEDWQQRMFECPVCGDVKKTSREGNEFFCPACVTYWEWEVDRLYVSVPSVVGKGRLKVFGMTGINAG